MCVFPCIKFYTHTHTHTYTYLFICIYMIPVIALELNFEKCNRVEDNPKLLHPQIYLYLRSLERNVLIESRLSSPTFRFSRKFFLSTLTFIISTEESHSASISTEVCEKNDDFILEIRKRPIIRGGIGSSHGYREHDSTWVREG